jgi:integrase
LEDTTLLRTKSGLPKYCCGVIDRHGKHRVRFRKGALSTYLTGTPWGEEFMRQYAAALGEGASKAAGNIGERRTLPGSFDALCVAYYRSSDFINLKASTQVMRRNILERFRSQHGHKPIKGLARAHVKQFFDAKSDTPEAANSLLKTLRAVLNYAISVDMLETNPTLEIKRNKSGMGNHVWTEEEIASFEAKHEIGTRARLAFDLLLYTSQRCGDVVRMGWQHVTDDTSIAVKQEKTGAKLMIPIHPKLRLSLASAPRTNMTFIMSQRGAPFASGTFSYFFKKACRSAGLAHCSAHGLRHSAATRLADAGCSISQIAAITGHKSLSQVAHYIRSVDQQKLAKEALKNQLRAEGEQEKSNLQTHVVQPGKK